MSLENLKQILKPPTNPIFGGQRSFEGIEKYLGTSLPTDYKKFISAYGVGIIDNFIWVFNPFVDNENLNFINRKKETLDSYDVLKNEFPNSFKHEVYPNTNGLLPWGITENGDELFWLTDGEPDKWKVVVYGTRSDEYTEYNCTLTTFLYKILSKELECEFFPDDFPSHHPTFIPCK